MVVEVRMFGKARECAGGETVEVAIALPAVVGEVVSALAAANPALRELLPCCAIAVGDEIVPRDFLIQPGADVAVLPPVSGGC